VSGETAADSRQGGEPPEISIVIPLYNEEANVEACCREVTQAMERAAMSYELILVDDGSEDGTANAARAAAGCDPRVTVIELRRNFGQTAAMAAGFDHARGRVLVPMDGDLQNDPNDIPALVRRLYEPPGWDAVSGWRKHRRDSLLKRLVPSKLANLLVSFVTGVHLHDYGCSLKAYRAEVLRDVKLYGEMHRFLPALVHWVGGRVTEMPVNHRRRRAGKSKYGLDRTLRVLLDLLTVKFMMGYLTKPIYFFGKIGGLTAFMALVTLAVVLVQKIGYDFDMTGNPLLYLSVMLVVVSVQFLLMGLMMEMLTRTYHESQGRRTYAVRSIHRAGIEQQPHAAS